MLEGDISYVLFDKILVTFDTRLEDMLNRITMFEVRLRSRLLCGFTVLLVRSSRCQELLPRLIR
jgi:hypothetical protein